MRVCGDNEETSDWWFGFRRGFNHVFLFDVLKLGRLDAGVGSGTDETADSEIEMQLYS